MHTFSAQDIQKLVPWPELINSLKIGFQQGCEAPTRHHHTINNPGGQNATLLLMPAWISEQYIGVKLITVFPDNPEKSIPSILGNYLLMDGRTGENLAMLDAGELTARRTAGASALASAYLSRKDSTKLLLVGSGRVAENAGFAHATVRPVQEIQIWARSREKAEHLAALYRLHSFQATAISSLQQGVHWADIISCATMSTEPLILGKDVRPGTHIDLIGAYKPFMRESDDALIAKARVFVDTTEGALSEAGDLLLPMENKIFHPEDVQADLAGLTRKMSDGRTENNQITLFKSVGCALEDLCLAVSCYKKSLEK